METPLQTETSQPKPITSVRPFWYKLKQNQMTWAGLGILGVIVLCSLIAPILTPYNPTQVDISQKFLGPSLHHWFGTDEVGRDILTRILYGARISLGVGITVIIMASVIGILIGTVSGYFGGVIDVIIMRIMDMVMAFPTLILAMALAAALGPSLQNAMLAIAIVKIPVYVRLARGESLVLREKLFVKSAQSFGINPWRIIGKHIVPNSVSPVVIQATLDVGDAILMIATLGFLGLGAQPPTPEWGAMISIGWKYLLDFWWYPTFPGLFLFLSAGSLNLIGDGIRDILDPKAGR
ncbi:peptide/nickel transport system permease protein [Fictibacillus enclensis]|uniref:D-ala-D-ala transporter subunit n=1 Tax=Fictibacillus enclensis TaxID=1017270 RepID=A0A0V8IZJ2_9BACL|nr:ABC transporter permease subunit [Fictibacillus enclensis]KSU80302.1 D-ala-D-ala transporter subunit [Fictibacillus enclensis]SCC37806.1 peptide/nickel transport system permease protein [Fictibacillus enclensis]